MIKKIVVSILFLSIYGKVKSQELLQITLEQAKEIALENNVDVKYSEMEVDKANKKVWETIAIGLPQITGNLSYNNAIQQPSMLLPGALVGSSEDYVVSKPFSPPQTVDANINTSLLLFDGSYIVGLLSTRVFLRISQLSKISTRESVLESVVVAYTSALVSEENFKITKKNLENTKKNYDEAKASYDAGLSDEDNVQQLEILYSNQKNLYSKSERDFEISQMNLSLVLRKELSTKYVFLSKIDNVIEKYISENLQTQENIKNFDIKNNIDFKITENNTETKRLLLRKEQSAYLPQLSTSLLLGRNAMAEGFDFFNSNQIWFKNTTISFKLSVPIFSSGMRWNKVGQARIDYEKSRIEETQKEKEIRVNLLKAKNDYDYAYDTYETSKKNLKLAENINRKEQLKNKEGLGSSMSLTDSYNQLYKTQQDYLQSIFSLVSSKMKIDKILKTEEEIKK